VSDWSQGPGWWQASDGRWYAPERHPDRRAPVPPPPGPPIAAQPPYFPPGTNWPPSGPSTFGEPLGNPPFDGSPPFGAPAKRGISSGVKAALIIGLALVLGLGGCAVAASVLIARSTKKVDSFANPLPALAGVTGCPLLSDRTAARVFGGEMTLIPLHGFPAIAGVALDNRVLPDADSCMFAPKDSAHGRIGRVARYKGADAVTVFANEVAKAKGLTQEHGNGNGTNVPSDAYYGKTVELDDEAFCTTAGASPLSGVLVRKGDTLVYVSLLPSGAQLDKIVGGDLTSAVGLDDENCALAQDVAAAVLKG